MPFVLGLATVWRSHAALAEGVTVGTYGLFVVVSAVGSVLAGTVPEHTTMSIVGSMALAANLLVAVLHFAYHNRDSNMRSVWLCTRNDALGNMAVLLAALGVLGTGSNWPEILVAVVMGVLGLTAARTVVSQARREFHVDRPALDGTSDVIAAVAITEMKRQNQ